MGTPYASGSKAIALCDVCGFEYRLSQLRKLTVAGTVTATKACPACWVPDQPQLMLGRFPVSDPQALRDPRPDNAYYISGVNVAGNPNDGLRVIEWGWAPVGGGVGLGEMTPNALLAEGAVGSVTVSTT